MPIENRDIDSTLSDDDTKKAAGRAIAARFDAVVASDPALQAQIRGMIRADADEEDKKPEVPEEKVADEDEEGSGDKVLAAVSKLAHLVGGLVDRVSAIENAKADEDEEEFGEGETRGDSTTERRRLAYQRAAAQRRFTERFHDIEQFMTPKNADYFSAAQARADACASVFGAQAPRPLAGESLRNYKIRLIRPYQKQSKTFGECDLRAVADAQLFEKIESTIWDEARLSANDPKMIPVGILREVRGKSDAGHTKIEFVGRPITWMTRFMPTGRAVTAIHTRPPTAPAQW